ncbi:hypothetical protein [Halosimplex sp. J119]
MRLRSLSLVLVAVCAVAVPLAAGSAGAAAAEKPTVDLSVGGTAISEGETYETRTDVGIRINASVGTDAAADTGLSEIVVRVGGERVRSIAVNGSSVSEQVAPDFSNGANSVRVIVTDDAGNVESTSFTVKKDAQAPHVYLTSPYETAPWKPIGDGTVNGSRATIEGNIIDDSAVEKIHISREFAGQKDTRVLHHVGENFSVEMDLGFTGEGGNGTNDFRITAVDEFGNVRIYTFSIDTTDERPPALSLEPFPNETTRNQVFLGGSVDDDVGIQKGTIEFSGPDGNDTESREISAPTESLLDRDRLSTTFNESFFMLYPGTYEATITVTDVTGKETSRTVTIERLSRSERDVAPEIAVDRDRTVVVASDRLFLSGVAFEGVTERLVVETRRADTGETLDYQVVHSGSRSDRVEFDREVAIGANRTDVIVRATDAKGVEHTSRFTVDGRTRETFVDESGDDGDADWPRVTVEPLRDEREGTATSAVTVRGAAAGTTVSIPDADGPNAVVETANVSVETLSIDLATEANVTANVVARERAGTPLDAPEGSSSAATVTVQHSVADAAVDGVTLELSVRRSYLEAQGIDPANLTVYRRSGGNWSALATTASSNETHVGYEVDSPDLSVFSLATDPALASADGSETAPNGTETDGPGDGAAADGETAPNGTDAEDPEANVVVHNVTVNRTAVAVNESVGVNVTLLNTGEGDGSYTPGLETVHGMNVSFVAKKSVAVPAGEQRQVAFTTRFATEGNHTVMVNGTQAGPVVVEGGGGLLSILSIFSFLSFLPLRLIGMAIGGIVGLLLVLVLLRFVLGKVGGGESTGG